MNAEKSHVLVVDDDKTIHRAIRRLLSDFELSTAEDGLAAATLIEQAAFDLVITDLRMPRADGFFVLEKVIAARSATPVIVLTGHGTVQEAVKAIRAGATDFLAKPFHPEDLIQAVERALRKAARRPSAAEPRIDDHAGDDRSADNLVGDRLEDVLRLVDRVASFDATVMITGESGTGKEVIARLLHGSSPRSRHRFVAINCGAIPESLVESELFGHAKGAFTGATEKRTGKFQLADKGTLFLDEIGDLPLPLQVKLVRAIQEKEVTPVGEGTPVKVDVRIITATLRNVETMVGEGTFREDLFYRLNVIPIDLPPLRAHPPDVDLLAEHFLRHAAARYGRTVQLAPATRSLLRAYGWPGNVRELKNLIERLVLTAQANVLQPDELPANYREATSSLASAASTVLGEAVGDGLTEAGIDLPQLLADIEHQLIQDAIALAGGNKTRAADLLKLNRTTMIEKLRRRGD